MTARPLASALLVVGAIAASAFACSSSNETVDTRADAGPPSLGATCITDHDCGSGAMCGYQLSEGCAATSGICLATPAVIPGGASGACSCNAQPAYIPFSYPAGYAPQPVASLPVNGRCPGDGDGGVEAGGDDGGPSNLGATCTTDKDCLNADTEACGYAISAGCAATSGVCVAVPIMKVDSAEAACGCGTEPAYVPNYYPAGYAPQPVASLPVSGQCPTDGGVDAGDAGLDADANVDAGD